MKNHATLLALLLSLIVPVVQADDQAPTADESPSLDSASMLVAIPPCGNSSVGVTADGLCVIGVDTRCHPAGPHCVESDLW